jgi:Ser/Thr protein kinase RdoA (MazF antagonist)
MGPEGMKTQRGLVVMKELLRTEFGLDADVLDPLAGGRVNRLWRCGKWVVKLYDHRQVPREQAERAVQLQARAAECWCPVPAPHPTRTGALWAEKDGAMVVVMPFLEGRRLERGRVGLTEAASLGALLGNLHASLRTLPTDQLAPPSPPSPDVIIERWVRLKEQALGIDSPGPFDQLVVEVADYADASVRRMPQVDWDTQPWQMCHGDLHLDNVLFDDDGKIAGLLDFDNAAPSWAGVELMTAWTLCLCADPGEPRVTPEAAAFFSAYQEANQSSADLATSLQAYWWTLMANTWPAAIHYREFTVKPEWIEILSMRYRAARWLEANLTALPKLTQDCGLLEGVSIKNA